MIQPRTLSFIKNISPQSASDAELVASFRQSGDLSVLGAVYQRYMDLVYGVSLKYLKDQEAAKDAVMVIFEELAQKLPRHEVDNFRSWLYTVAKNHCLMQLRSGKRVKLTEFDPDHMQSSDHMHPDAVWEKEARLDQLSACLETLVPEQKMTVELFYLQGKSYKEIETITGLEYNQVRSHIQNGRRNLKICVERQQGDEDPKQVKMAKQ